MSVERARRLRKEMTPPEVTLWLRLRELKQLGWHFRKQSPECGYVVDFVCRPAKLVVEVDGLHHSGAEQSDHDKDRDAVLAANGYLVLRFWAADVMKETDGVLETIVAALSERAAPGSARPNTAPSMNASQRYNRLRRLGLRRREA
ncbi:MAG: DUF559 domain-containing protein [Pseudomonadota bacterium]